MGLFDKFRNIYQRSKKKTAAPKHTIKDDRSALKKQFMAVGSSAAAAKPAKESEAPAATKPEKKKKILTSGLAPRVLLRPLVTEKLSLSANTYAFAVAPEANRTMVKQAVWQLYGVKPQTVNIINRSGKAVRYGRASGTTKAWKKAVVILPSGKNIDVFES